MNVSKTLKLEKHAKKSFRNVAAPEAPYSMI